MDKSTLTKRSPIKDAQDAPHRVTVGTPITGNFPSPINNKRLRLNDTSPSGSSTKDNQQDTLSAILLAMERNQREVTSKMDSHHQDLTKSIDDVGTRVGSLESTVTKATNDICALQHKIDEIEQDKLVSHMVINGADPKAVEAHKSDIVNFALSLIRSYKIAVSDCDVEEAFALSRGEARRIVIVFKSVSAKNAVMAAKRACKDTRNIYFDHRVTVKYGELLRQLRLVAKTSNGRAFLFGGRVYYQKDGNPRIRVNSLADVEAIKCNSLPQ